MQQFVRAEPSGYIALHLHPIGQMQSYFHVTGRLQYAYSSQVYMQTMEALEKKCHLKTSRNFLRIPTLHSAAQVRFRLEFGMEFCSGQT